MKNNNNQENVSSGKTIIIWGITLSVISIIMVLIFISQYNSFSDKKNISVAVALKTENMLQLRLYPDWFYYDSNCDSLYLSKVIGKDEKEQLLNLISADDTSFADYKSAIDELAFKASQNGRLSASLLLIICGIIAILGVQARTMWNFIGRVCYKKGVDMNTWWPWYALRPLIGFIIGIVIFLIWDLDLLNLGNNDKGNLNYLLFVGFLSGFAIQDVIEFIRKVAKKIFSPQEPEKNKDQ